MMELFGLFFKQTILKLFDFAVIEKLKILFFHRKQLLNFIEITAMSILLAFFPLTLDSVVCKIKLT